MTGGIKIGIQVRDSAKGGMFGGIVSWSQVNELNLFKFETVSYFMRWQPRFRGAVPGGEKREKEGRREREGERGKGRGKEGRRRRRGRGRKQIVRPPAEAASSTAAAAASICRGGVCVCVCVCDCVRVCVCVSAGARPLSLSLFHTHTHTHTHTQTHTHTTSLPGARGFVRDNENNTRSAASTLSLRFSRRGQPTESNIILPSTQAT